jgi:nucleoside-diphosphate-sugar epimerase
MIAKKISKQGCLFYILSTRQVYKPQLNITENSLIKPINIYAKNNFYSEKNCFKILNNKLIVLRLSNIVGYELKKKKPSLMSLLIKGIKNKIVTLDENCNYKKDILPIRYLILIIFKIIKSDYRGIINIGSGVTLTLIEIYKYLTYKKKCKLIIKKNKKKNNDNNYSYNIKKLHKITKFKISKKKVYDEFDKLKILI